MSLLYLVDAELRLAVGIPNFALAQQKSLMVDFRNYMLSSTKGVKYGANRSNMMLSNYVSQSYPGYAGLYMDSEPTKTKGAQAEDFYFYSVRPGNFPKHSRYQYPVLEADVLPVHFYECVLTATTIKSFYDQEERNKSDDNYPVFHFIEFKNTSAQPWTTGSTVPTT